MIKYFLTLSSFNFNRFNFEAN